MKNRIYHIIFVIILLITQFRLAQATTVSQVLNNLRSQNFSEQTLNYVEHLLENFVDENDRLGGHISQKATDRNHLRKILNDEFKRVSNEEYSHAICLVQQHLNFNKKLRNASGAMRLIEGGFRHQGLFDILSHFFSNIPHYEAFDLIQKFLDEIRATGKYETFSPKKKVVHMLKNLANKHKAQGYSLKVEFTSLDFEALKYQIDSMITSMHHTVRDLRTFLVCNNRSLDVRLVYLDADINKLSKKFVMKCITNHIYHLSYSELIKCIFIYVFYLDLFSSNMRESTNSDQIIPVDELLEEFEETFNNCLHHDHFDFRKDLSLRYPWWVYAPKDTYNIDTVFEYP